MVATEPLPDDVWAEIGWDGGELVSDLRHLFFYAQRTTDGRIAIGGRGAPYRLDAPISEQHERNDAVKHRLRRRSTATSRRRGGSDHPPLGRPAGRAPRLVHERQLRPATGLGWAGGYAGHGVVAANISGRTLADLVLGRDTDCVACPGSATQPASGSPSRCASSPRARSSGSWAAPTATRTRPGKPARRTAIVAPFIQPH